MELGLFWGVNASTTRSYRGGDYDDIFPVFYVGLLKSFDLIPEGLTFDMDLENLLPHPQPNPVAPDAEKEHSGKYHIFIMNIVQT